MPSTWRVRTVAATSALGALPLLGDAADNGLAHSPPRGWRSWTCFGADVNQTLIEAVMKQLVARRGGRDSLKDLGFSDVGLEDGWQACESGAFGSFHDEFGRPNVNTSRFPDLANMTDRARQLGLTTSWSVNSCVCPETGFAASTQLDQRYAGDAQAVLGYGFDGVKIDHCGPLDDVARWAALFNNSGRRVLMENCHWVRYAPYFEEDGSLACPFNFFRVGDDVQPTFDSMLSSLQAMPKWTARERPISRPGCWAYLDALQVGRLPTFEENRAHFAAWSITSSPLMLGVDLFNDSQMDIAWSVVSNKEVLDVNENWAGHPGTLVASHEVNLEDILSTYPTAVPCNAADPAQNGWRLEEVQGGAPGLCRIVSGNGLCVDVSVGTPIGLQSCRNNSESQMFVMRPDGAITWEADGQSECIEVAGKSGPVLQRRRCFDVAPKHQRFTFNNGMWQDAGTPDDDQYPPRCLAVSSDYPSALSAHYIKWQVWAKPQPGGALAVLVLNRAQRDLSPTIHFESLKEKFGDLFAVEDTGRVLVRDLFQRKDVGKFRKFVETGQRVPLRDSTLLLLTPLVEETWLSVEVRHVVPVLLVVFLFLVVAVLSVVLCPMKDTLAEWTLRSRLASSSDSEWTSTDENEPGKAFLEAPPVTALASDDGADEEDDAAEAEEGTSVAAQDDGDATCQRFAQVGVLTLLWWCAAIFVTLMVKFTVVNVPHSEPLLPPFILTCLVNTLTGFFSWVLSCTCQRSDSVLPSATRVERSKVVALGLIQGCEIGFVNKSLQYITISERTMLQNTNVLLVMVTAQVLGLEALTVCRSIAGLLLVGGGVMQGLESGDQGGLDEIAADDHWKGMVFMLSSMLLTSCKWSQIQFMTQRSPPESYLGQMSKFELAARLQPITGVVCFALAASFERPAITNPAIWHSGQLVRVPFIAAGITVIMCSELKLVQLTSAVAMGVLVNLHHIPMVLAGVTFFHDRISVLAICGFALNVVGGFWYAAARKCDAKAATQIAAAE